MTSKSTTTLHLKKLSINEGSISNKASQSPSLGSHRKFQHIKPFMAPNPEQSITTPKPLSIVLSGASPRSNLIHSPKSLKFSSQMLTPKEKVFNGIYAFASPTSSSQTGIASHRAVKGHVPKLSIDIKSLSPSKTHPEKFERASSMANALDQAELVHIIQKKNEEVDYLRKSTQELHDKAGSMIRYKRKSMKEDEGFEELQKDLEQKDQIIEIYEKLLTLCGNEQGSLNKITATEGNPRLEGQHNRKVTEKNNSIRVDRKSLFRMKTHYNSNSLTKSTNPTLSKLSFYNPSFEKNDSKHNSKLVEQEQSSPSQLEISPMSPDVSGKSKARTHRGDSKATDIKLKALESIYKQAFKHSQSQKTWNTKSGLSRSLNPYAEILPSNHTISTRRRQTSGLVNQESDINSVQETVSKNVSKSDFGAHLVEGLNGITGRLDSVLRKYEEESAALLKMNEEIKAKIKQLELGTA